MTPIQVNQRKRNAIRRKKHQKYKKQDASDSTLSRDSDFSNNSDHRRKRRKKKSHRKKDPIKLCARLTEKFLTTAYKSKIIRFKMDEYPLQCWICFLTLVESLEMIFSQHKKTCEVLLDYPKIGGDNIKDFSKIPLGIFCMQILMYIAGD